MSGSLAKTLYFITLFGRVFGTQNPESPCHLSWNGTSSQHFMVSNPNVMTEVEIIRDDVTEFCNVKFLLVSGGGQSDYCGGGSGRILYFEKHLASSHHYLIQIVVGGERNESTLSIVGEIPPVYTVRFMAEIIQKKFGYGIVTNEMFEKKMFQITCHMMGCNDSSVIVGRGVGEAFVLLT